MAKPKAFRGHVPGLPTASANDRFPCGKLRAAPVPPNARVIAARKVLGLPDNATISAIGYAYRRGWIDQTEVITAESYLDAYNTARVGAPGVSVQRNDDFSTGAAAMLDREWYAMTDAQVMALRWNELTRAEVAAIWDSAFRPAPSSEGGGPKRALLRWRVMSGACSQAELTAIDRIVLLDGWPAWIIERNDGRFDSPSETDRHALISGLRKMASAWRQAKAVPPANDDHGNDNAASNAARRKA